MEKHGNGNGNGKCSAVARLVSWAIRPRDYGNQIQKIVYAKMYENPIGGFGGFIAHIIEDAARVLRTKFDSSDTSALVATEG